VASSEIGSRAKESKKGKEVVDNQKQVKSLEEQVGKVDSHIFKEEEAGGCGDMKPAPALLAERLVSLQH
jgi:hypothetical protein